MKNLSDRAVRKNSRLAALVFAMAALAAACGAGTGNDASFGESVEGTSNLDTSQSGASDSDNSDSDNSDSDNSDSDNSDSDNSDSDSSQSGAGSDADDPIASESGADDGSASSANVPVHLFPDMDVIDIQTGTTINLAAELAGGDTPILLWFWAPH